MNNNLRLKFSKRAGERVAVAHVSENRGCAAIEKGCVKKIRARCGGQSVSTNLCTQKFQPSDRPSALKAAVPGYQNPFPAIESMKGMRHQRSQSMRAA